MEGAPPVPKLNRWWYEVKKMKSSEINYLNKWNFVSHQKRGILVSFRKKIISHIEKVKDGCQKIRYFGEFSKFFYQSGPGFLAGSRRVHRHPYCRVFKLKKSKKRKIQILEKTGFPGPDPD